MPPQILGHMVTRAIVELFWRDCVAGPENEYFLIETMTLYDVRGNVLDIITEICVVKRNEYIIVSKS